MDEDEIRYVLMHEIGHSLAGWKAQHYNAWADVCRFIGQPKPAISFVVRRWDEAAKVWNYPRGPHISRLPTTDELVR